MSPNPTAELAAFIANLRYEDIPSSVRERVKDFILDAAASALAGQQGDEVRQVQALANALGASREASVIAPRLSGSSVSPSPTKHQTRRPEVSRMPRSWR